VLPRGTVSVGGGVLVLGVSSYLYLALAARSLSLQQFGEISVLYSVVYTAGAGAFLPVEQELGRALSDRRTRGVGGGPLIRRATAISGLYAAGLVILTLVTGPFTVPRLFDGSWALLLCLVVALVGLWGAYLTRGVLAGSDRFGGYGAQLAVEGTSRILGVVVLAAVGVTTVGLYGLLIGAGLLVGVVVTLPPTLTTLTPGPSAGWQELSAALGWLLVGSLLTQVLVNAPPIATKLLATAGDSVLAGQILTGTVLTRLPLFAFSAVQAALLPRLASQLAVGDVRGFVRGLGQLLVATGLVTAATTAVAAVAGRDLLHLFFGNRYNLGNSVLVRLALASGLYMAAVIVGQSLLAMQRYREAAMGWVVGVAGLVVVVAVGNDLVTRVVDSFLVGTLAALLALAAALVRNLRSLT
jgi:O-antigen/teichoic acid export membrane protein